MVVITDHEVHILSFLGGGAGAWTLSALISTMPPYSGSNYFIKWLWAFLHVVGANLDKVHIPGSAADIAAGPKP